MCKKYLTFILCLSFLSAVRAQVNCVTCDASTNDNCITNPTAITAEVCSTNTCYTQIATGIVTRGCLASGTTCTGDNCVTCTDNNCNAQQTICQACNSDSDTTCAQLSATNNAYNSICTTANAQCYVGVTEDGTVRRCALTTDTCEEDSTTCRLCTGSNCNNFVLDETTATTAAAATTTVAPTTTAAAATTTAAPTTTAAAGTTTAAPTTTAAAATTTAGGAATTTVAPTTTAAGGAATTAAPATTAPSVTIKCIECSSANTTSCLGTPASIPGTDCPGGVCYQAWEDNVYHRGCLSTAESTLSSLCSGTSEQCKTCSTNLCNVEVVNGAATTQLTFGLIISLALLACRNAL